MVTAAEAQAELDRRAAQITPAQARAELARRAPLRPMDLPRNNTPLVPGGLDSYRSPVAASIGTNPLNGGHDPDVAAELDRRQQWASNPQYYTNRARIATLAHGGTFGLQDELTGVGGGAIDAIKEALHPTGEGVGAAYQRGYRDSANEVRGDIAQYRRERPGEALGVEVAGGLMSPANRVLSGAVARLPFGAALTRAAAGKGVPAWMAQTAQGVEAGTLGGGVYGFNTGDDGDRLANAGQGAEFGAVLGGAIPSAVNVARPFLRPIARAGEAIWNRLPTADPNVAVGAFPGGLQWNRPQPASVIPPHAADIIDRLAANSGTSAADFQAAAADARATPQGQVLGDVFHRAGRSYIRGATHFTGKAGDIVEPVVESRFANAPGHIESALRRGLGVGDQTTAGARAALDAQEEALRPQYDALFGPTTDAQQSLYQQRVHPILEAAGDALRGPLRETRDIFNLERANGHVEGDLNANLGRYLHILKNRIGEAADFEAGQGQGMRAGQLRQIYGRLNEALDPQSGEAIIPGYRQVSQQQQAIFQARRALTQGAQWLDGDANAVRQEMAQMSQSERYHARIGLAERIIRATAGAEGRNMNVANAIANNNRRAVIAAAFDNPAQAAQFLEKVANTQGALARNAAAWLGGSSTAENQAQHALSAADVISAARAARGGPGEIAGHVAHSLWNAARLGAVERNYAQATRTLMTPIDTPESETFAKEVARIIRQRAAARARSAARNRAAASGLSATQRNNGAAQ